MTASEIRALYVETLARAQRSVDLAYYPQREDGTPREDWEAMTEWVRKMYLDAAVPFVDALAAAGLLSTEARWKTSGAGGDSPGWWPDKASAVADWDRVQRQCAEMVGDWVYESPTLKREYTTGWQEVQP